MIVVIILSALLCPTILARPQGSPSSVAKINVYDYVQEDPGQYYFNVETSDGFHHDARGELVPVGYEDKKELVVRGSYSYIGPDGIRYTINYVADSNGFQPIGVHLPGFAKKPHLPPPATTPVVPIVQVSVSASCYASLCGAGLG